MSSQPPNLSTSSSAESISDPEKQITTPTGSPEDIEKGRPEPETPISATEWNGPDDPDNPLSWSKWKRYYHVIPPAMISFSA
jgi:hypothetical protein